jgi:hypothetical protein
MLSFFNPQEKERKVIEKENYFNINSGRLKQFPLKVPNRQ